MKRIVREGSEWRRRGMPATDWTNALGVRRVHLDLPGAADQARSPLHQGVREKNRGQVHPGKRGR